MIEQVAQEAVELDAGELLGYDGGRRHVGHGAAERSLMAGVQEALLHADAHLNEHVAHAVGVLEDGFAPDLARDLRKHVDLLGQGASRHGELGRGELPVGLADDLAAEREEAQVGVDIAIQLRGGTVLGGKLLHEAREHGDVGELGEREMRDVEVLDRIREPVRGDVVLETGKGRLGVECERGLGARLADIGHVQAR